MNMIYFQCIKKEDIIESINCSLVVIFISFVSFYNKRKKKPTLKNYTEDIKSIKNEIYRVQYEFKDNEILNLSSDNLDKFNLDPLRKYRLYEVFMNLQNQHSNELISLEKCFQMTKNGVVQVDKVDDIYYKYIIGSNVIKIYLLIILNFIQSNLLNNELFKKEAIDHILLLIKKTYENIYSDNINIFITIVKNLIELSQEISNRYLKLGDKLEDKLLKLDLCLKN